VNGVSSVTRKNDELKQQIKDIDDQIRELKQHVEQNISPTLNSYVKRTMQLEDYMERLSHQFGQSNRLTIQQTEELVKSLEKIKEEIRSQTSENQNLMKKFAPIITLLTVAGYVALELLKYLFK
jgi:DNA repair exonuclease SbcCD ATPase subunit